MEFPVSSSSQIERPQKQDKSMGIGKETRARFPLGFKSTDWIKGDFDSEVVGTRILPFSQKILMNKTFALGHSFRRASYTHTTLKTGVAT